MRRNEKDMPEHLDPAGVMLKRNPGVTLLWSTLRYSIFKDGHGGALFNVGDPERVEFFAEGRKAKHAEIMAVHRQRPADPARDGRARRA